MIIAEKFLWLHLPKTGGTSMNRLFRERSIPDVYIDPDQSSTKHDSVDLREGRSLWRSGGRRRFFTIRHLEDWLISDWHHKRRHMNLPDLDFSPVRSGLFYSLRLGGIWVSADWWLSYFKIDETCTPLRLENLSFDLNLNILPLLPETTLPFEMIPFENSKPLNSQAPISFSESDRRCIFNVNPRWSALENRIY